MGARAVGGRAGVATEVGAMEGVATVAAFELPASFDDSTLRSASTTVSIALALAHYVATTAYCIPSLK